MRFLKNLVVAMLAFCLLSHYAYAQKVQLMDVTGEGKPEKVFLEITDRCPSTVWYKLRIQENQHGRWRNIFPENYFVLDEMGRKIRYSTAFSSRAGYIIQKIDHSWPGQQVLIYWPQDHNLIGCFYRYESGEYQLYRKDISDNHDMKKIPSKEEVLNYFQKTNYSKALSVANSFAEYLRTGNWQAAKTTLAPKPKYGFCGEPHATLDCLQETMPCISGLSFLSKDGYYDSRSKKYVFYASTPAWPYVAIEIDENLKICSFNLTDNNGKGPWTR